MVDFSVIRIPTMQLLHLIPHETILKHLTSPVWDALGEINDIKLDALPINDNDEITWDDYSGHVSWTVAFIVIALVAIMIYIIFLLYRNKLIIPVIKRDQSCVTDTGDTDLMCRQSPLPANLYYIPVKLVWFLCLPTGTRSARQFHVQETMCNGNTIITPFTHKPDTLPRYSATHGHVLK